MIFLKTYKIPCILKNYIFVTVILLFFFNSSGCGFRSSSGITYHNLDYPSPAVEYANPLPDVLMVYKFLSGPSLDTLFLTTTDNNSKQSIVSQHRWQDNPVDLITELVLRDIETSRLFEKAVDQWSNLRYRYALEGTIQRLNGEVKDQTAIAVVEAEVSFIDFEASHRSKKVIFKKSYRVDEPSANKTPTMIAEAINRAVRKLSKKIRDDVAVSVKRVNPESEIN